MQRNDYVGVFDNVLSSEEHQKVFDHLNKCNWQIFKPSSDVDLHFTSVFLNNLMDIPEEYEIFKQFHNPIHVLYEKIVELATPHIGNFSPTQIYANCKPYGLNSYIHTDQGGKYTFIYYANIDWKSQYEGGTSLYAIDADGKYDCIRYVSYKPNRLLIIPSNVPHRGMPVDRNHFGARFIVVARGK
jgi:hypothetical protein